MKKMKTMKKMVSMLLTVMMVAMLVVTPITPAYATGMSIPLNEDFVGETVDSLKAQGWGIVTANKDISHVSVANNQLVLAPSNANINTGIYFNLDSAIKDAPVEIEMKWTAEQSGTAMPDIKAFASSEDYVLSNENTAVTAGNSAWLLYLAPSGTACIYEGATGTGNIVGFANYTKPDGVTTAPSTKAGQWTMKTTIDPVAKKTQTTLIAPGGYYVELNENTCNLSAGVKNIGLVIGKQAAFKMDSISITKATTIPVTATLPVEEDFTGETVDSLKAQGWGIVTANKDISHVSIANNQLVLAPSNANINTGIYFNLDSAIKDTPVEIEMKWTAEQSGTAMPDIKAFASSEDYVLSNENTAVTAGNSAWLLYLAPSGTACIYEGATGTGNIVGFANYTKPDGVTTAPSTKAGQWTMKTTIDPVAKKTQTTLIAPEGHYVELNENNCTLSAGVKNIGLVIGKQAAFKMDSIAITKATTTPVTATLPVEEDFTGETVDSLKAQGWGIVTANKNIGHVSVANNQLVLASSNGNINTGIYFNLDSAIKDAPVEIEMKWTAEQSGTAMPDIKAFASSEDYVLSNENTAVTAGNSAWLLYLAPSGTACIYEGASGTGNIVGFANYTKPDGVTTAPSTKAGQWTMKTTIDPVAKKTQTTLIAPEGHYVELNENTCNLSAGVKNIGLVIGKQAAFKMDSISITKATTITAPATLPVEEDFTGETVDSLKAQGWGFGTAKNNIDHISVADGKLVFSTANANGTTTLYFDLETPVADKAIEVDMTWNVQNNANIPDIKAFASGKAWQMNGEYAIPTGSAWLTWLAESGSAFAYEGAGAKGDPAVSFTQYCTPTGVTSATAKNGTWKLKILADPVNKTSDVTITGPAGQYVTWCGQEFNVGDNGIASLGMIVGKQQNFVLDSFSMKLVDPVSEKISLPIYEDFAGESLYTLKEHGWGYSDASLHKIVNGQLNQTAHKWDNIWINLPRKIVDVPVNIELKWTVLSDATKTPQIGCAVDDTDWVMDSTTTLPEGTVPVGQVFENGNVIHVVNGSNYTTTDQFLHETTPAPEFVLQGQWTLQVTADPVSDTTTTKFIAPSGHYTSWTKTNVGLEGIKSFGMCIGCHSELRMDSLSISEVYDEKPILNGDRVIFTDYDGTEIEANLNQIKNDVGSIELHFGTAITAGDKTVSLTYMNGDETVTAEGVTGSIVDGRSYVLRFNNLLKSAKKYTLTVPAGAFVDESGNANDLFTYEFTTTEGKIEVSLEGFTNGTDVLSDLNVLKAADKKYAVFTYENGTDVAKDSVLLVGYFAGDKLLAAEVVPTKANLKANKKETISIALTEAIPEGTASVRMFVWNTLEEMLPYAEPYAL